MTTATSELFSNNADRSANTASPLLSLLTVILGVNLRETLSTQASSQEDAAYAWGL